MASEQEIDEVKERHSTRLFNIQGVSGVGVERDDDGQFVLTIHVETDDPEVYKQLPKQIEGYPVKVVQSGTYSKLPLTDKK